MIGIFCTEQALNFILGKVLLAQILGTVIDTAIIGRIFLIQPSRCSELAQTLTVLDITIP